MHMKDLTIKQDPYLNQLCREPARYYGTANDKFGNEYAITWAIKDNYLPAEQDETDACDWENPMSIELTDEAPIREMFFYHQIEDKYEDMLNECYDIVKVCGYEYNAGHALRLLDETAFGCGVSDWSSEEYEELRAKDMSQAERDHYYLSENQVMYCHVDEVYP